MDWIETPYPSDKTIGYRLAMTITNLLLAYDMEYYTNHVIFYELNIFSCQIQYVLLIFLEYSVRFNEVNTTGKHAGEITECIYIYQAK